MCDIRNMQRFIAIFMEFRHRIVSCASSAQPVISSPHVLGLKLVGIHQLFLCVLWIRPSYPALFNYSNIS